MDHVLPRPKNWRALATTVVFAGLVLLTLGLNPPPCYELVVASSQEKYGILKDIADRYAAKRVNRQCVKVTVILKRSGDAQEALRRGWQDSDGKQPHVWTPAATTWVRLLQQHLAADGRPPLIPPVPLVFMQSPLVVAMPKPMAEALFNSRGHDVSWREIFGLARDPRGWAALGHPEWGRFALGKTEPTVSTSGLHGLLATYHAARNSSDPPNLADLDRPEVIEFVRSVDAAVTVYAESVGAFLENLYERDQRGDSLQFVSALPIEEKQLFEYNRGNPSSEWPPPARARPIIPLVAVYPSPGTFSANHPYVVLNGIEAPYVQAAEDFFRHLITPEVQRLFCAAGFRDRDGVACTEPPPEGIDRNKPGATLSAPAGEVIAEIQRRWPRVR